MKKTTVKGLALSLGIITAIGAGVGAFAAGSAIAKKNAAEMAMETATIMEQEKKELTASADAKQSEIEKQAEEAIKKAEAERDKAEKEAKAAKEAAEKAKADQKAAAEKAEAERRAAEEAAKRAKEEAAKKDIWSVNAVNYDAYATASDLKVREQATTNSNILATLSKDEQVRVIGEVMHNGQATSWVKVNYGGLFGYVCSDWLTTKKPEVKDIWSVNEVNYDAYATVDDLKVREQATTNSNILATLSKDEQVRVIGEVMHNGQATNWAKVNYGGLFGYVCSDWLTTNRPASRPTPQQTDCRINPNNLMTVHVESGYLALRSDPSAADEVEIGQLHSGNDFYVFERNCGNGNYAYGFDPQSNQYGYVNQNYLVW